MMDLNEAVNRMTDAAERATDAAERAATAANDATAAARDAKSAANGATAAANATTQNMHALTRGQRLLRRDMALLWRRVFDADPPPPPKGWEQPPADDDHELRVAPTSDPPLSHVLEETTGEVSDLEARMVKGFASVQLELGKQSDKMGIGKEGLAYFLSAAGQKQIKTNVTLVAAVLASVVMVVQSCRPLPPPSAAPTSIQVTR